jgi:hypothetical protein
MREVRLLCKKIVSYFLIISKQSEGGQGLGVSQELLSLIQGIAHYSRRIVGIGINATVHSKERLKLFIDSISKSTSVEGIRDAKVSPVQLKAMVSARADHCSACAKPIQDECYEIDGRPMHIACAGCPRCHRRNAFTIDDPKAAGDYQDVQRCKNLSISLAKFVEICRAT